MKFQFQLKKSKLTKKSLQIDKNQSAILTAVAAATIVSIFCLTSAKVLLNQALYQRRVINARNSSASQLDKDIADAKTLENQYNTVFLGSSGENIIGGTAETGTQNLGNTTNKNGPNDKIVLDALPTQYDFPALLTSLSNLLTVDGIGAQSIGGTDQSATFNSDPSYNPQPSSIDLGITGTTTYGSVKKLVSDLEHSIRPFDITQMTLTGSDSNLTFNLSVTTYYQPAKTLNLPSKEIK